RLRLALTVASSFVQLLDSPWLQPTFTKTDIIFINDSDFSQSCVVRLDQPYVRQSLEVDKISSARKNRDHHQVTDSLDQLAIILLKLGFSKALKDQKCRRDYDLRAPAADNCIRSVYDVMAARKWQSKISDFVGQNYAEIVSWCFDGNRSAP
ncbi:hypothetical protein B0T09DRAFT_400282, partial [Sordaria sp. MPI-SDFR-AT-0083]